MKIDLENSPKIRSGFTTPENYFEGFGEDLMRKIKSEENVPVVSIFQRRKKTFFAVAASVAAVAIGLTFTFSSGNSSSPDSVAMENYLAEQSNVSQYEIIQELDQNDIEALEREIVLIDNATAESVLSESNYIENYLSE